MVSIVLRRKAKVAFAAVQGDLAMAALVKKFDVHPNQITDWKKQLLDSAPDLFGKGAGIQYTDCQVLR